MRDALWTFWEEVYTFSSDLDTLTDNINTEEKHYRYRLDYSSSNLDFPKFPLPDTYTYCSDCSESFPNSILYSEISLPGQTFDNYRSFLSNSTKEIPGDTGEITDLFVKDANLFTHTENNLWRINISPQQLKTGTDTIQVGQGEFLGLTPVKMFDTKEGFAYGGTIDKFASVFAQNSYIWVDRKSSSIFKLDKEIKSISDTGLDRFFSNNVMSDLDSQFQSLACIPYPHQGTSCNKNVGFRACYDPEHHRYILTKKDYKLTDDIMESIQEVNIVDGLLVPSVVGGNPYFNDEGLWVAGGTGDNPGLLRDFNLLDKTISENRCWTMSFSLTDNVWLSYHSYLPNWLYNDSVTFYSHISNFDSNLYRFSWEHNYGEYQTYYLNKFDFIIDFIYKKNPYTEKTFDTVEYSSNVYLESDTDREWIEIPFITFDQMYVYNNNQLSNKKDVFVSNLNPYSENIYNIQEASAHKSRNVWKINRFRDLSVNKLALLEPQFTSDWFQVDYSNQFENGFGYIDKIINPDYISTSKNVYQQERFTDKYLGSRLFFKPVENYKIIFNIQSGLKRDKI